MMKKYIVIVSDCTDVAYNEMRAKILHEIDNEKIKNNIIVEPLVPAKEFSIINGAFLVRLMADLYPPKNTIFLVVINPCKIRPARLIGETNNGFKFVAANTGTINWLISDFGLKNLYELKNCGFFPFGGKFVHAPATAKLALGKNFDELGEKRDKNFLVNFHIPDGTVVHIDNFGIIKIKGKPPNYDDGDVLEIYINGKKRLDAIFTHRMMSLDDGVWALYPGSSLGGMPELGKVRSLNGADEIDVNIGDMIRWKKKT